MCPTTIPSKSTRNGWPNIVLTASRAQGNQKPWHLCPQVSKQFLLVTTSCISHRRSWFLFSMMQMKHFGNLKQAMNSTTWCWKVTEVRKCNKKDPNLQCNKSHEADTGICKLTAPDIEEHKHKCMAHIEPDCGQCQCHSLPCIMKNHVNLKIMQSIPYMIT